MLDHIRRYRRDTGISPSIRNLMQLANLRSTATVHQHLSALERKGCIRVHGPRGIQVLVAEPDVEDRPGLRVLNRTDLSLDAAIHFLRQVRETDRATVTRLEVQIRTSE